jgi:molybdate transport system substrate-binding protein
MRKVFIICVLLGVLGLGVYRARPDQVSSSELLVAAASNLSGVFTAGADEFQKSTGIKVTLSFGSTGNLAKQIQNGAPFDLFAAADVATVDSLIQGGFILPESKRLYARGRLIIWWPADSKVQLDTPQDLLKPEIQRVAIANPDVAPYGAAAKASLIALGLWDTLQPKVVYADTVAAAKQFVSTGNADVGFIPVSLVQPGKDRFLAVSQRLHPPLDQALGIVKGAKNQDAAQRFSDFLASAEGQGLLEDYWYSIP